MTASVEFSRIISARAFLRPALLPATLLATISGLLLAGVFVVVGAMSWMLIEFPPTQPASSETASESSSTVTMPPGQLSPWAAAVISRVQRAVRPEAAIWLLAASLIVLFVLRWTIRSLAGAFLEKYVTEVILRLRQHIHRKAIRLEPADLTGEQTQATDSLFQFATTTLENAAFRWGHVCLTSALDLAAATAVACSTGWRTAAQTVIPILIGRLALRAESQRTDAALVLLTEQVNRGLARMAEGLRKTKIVTGFGMEQTEHDQFERHLSDYRDRCRVLRRQQSRGRGIRNTLLLIMIAVPAVVIGLRVMNGEHPANAIMLGFCLYAIYSNLSHLESRRELETEGGEKADQIAEYLLRVPGVSQAPGAGFLQPMSKTLSFNQISYQTPQLPGLLRGLDLRVSAGERLALLSLNPVCAQALAGMIPRFIDPDFGQVLIDGRDIREATLESLRAEAVFVTGQDAVFNATVLENITCGQADISRQKAVDAAKMAHADHFIRTLPRGYETMLGEHGVPLDAGQIFRLSLARAAARSPALLVIEEPAVSLNAETKAMLDDAYQRTSAGRTVIFLPHRLSTVKRCSRIVVIHDGRVAADGVHDQLVRTSELYRHWEYMRFHPFREDSD